MLKLPYSKFKFNFVSEETATEPHKDFDETKAAVLYNLSGKFYDGKMANIFS